MLGCHKQNDNAPVINIDNQFKVLKETLKYYANGGNKYEKSGYEIDATEIYDNYSWISVTKVLKDSPKVEIALRTHTPIKSLNNTNINEYLAELDKEFPAIKYCFDNPPENNQNPKLKTSDQYRQKCEERNSSVEVGSLREDITKLTANGSNSLDVIFRKTTNINN